MTFEDVLADLDNAAGIEFHPIGKKGSPVIVKKVDRNTLRIVIQSVKTGKILSRSFSELRTVWEELNSKPAVHVDAALEGSGSSRNQPETLFANLPYIEYLFIKNKKHIALMPAKTHELGEIHEMDPIQAQKVKVSLKNSEMKVGHPTALIVVADIMKGVGEIESVCGVRVETVCDAPGLYKLYKAGNRALVVEQKRLTCPISCGAYAILTTKSGSGHFLGIEVDGYRLLTPKADRPPYILVQHGQ